MALPSATVVLGLGTVFQLVPTGIHYKRQNLWNFDGSSGEGPGSLILAPGGLEGATAGLYGVTAGGGVGYTGGNTGYGVVFEVNP